MASRFWVGGSGTWDASDTTHWAATSGGAGGQSVPGSSDDVTLDGASGGGTVTVNTNFSVISLLFDAFTGTLDFATNNNSPTLQTIRSSGTATRTFNMGSGTFTITGNNATVFNFGVVTNMTLNAGTSTVNFTYSGSTGTRTITTSAASTFYNFSISAGSDAISTFGSTTFNSISFAGFSGSWAQTTNSLSFMGNLTLGIGMTVSSGSGTMTFNNTSGTQTITSNGVQINHPITVNAPGATVTLADALDMTGASDRTFAVTAGSFDSNSKNMSFAILSTSNSNVRAITLGTSTITLTGSATTIWSSSTATNLTASYASSTINCTYSGSTGTRTFSTGATPVFGTINFTAGSDIVTFSNTTNNIGTLNFTGFTGNLNTINVAYNITGNLTFGAGMSVTSGAGIISFTGTAGTQTVTSNGTQCNHPMTINTSGSIVQLADPLDINGATNRLLAITGGTFDANNKAVTAPQVSSSGAVTRAVIMGDGRWTVTGANATVWNFTTITNLTFTPGALPVIFNYSGSAGTRTIIAGTMAEGTAPAFNITAGSDSVVLGNSGNRYGSVDFTGFSGTWIRNSGGSVSTYGNLTLSSTMTIAVGTFGFSFISASAAQTLTSNGVTFNSPVTVAGTGTSSFSLIDNLMVNDALTLTSGIFNPNNKDVTIASFASSGSTARTLSMGSGMWTITGSGTVWSTGTTTNLTFNKDTATILLNESTSATKTIGSGNLSFYNITLGGTGTGTFVIGTNATTMGIDNFVVTNPPHTVQIFAGKTLISSSLTWSGTVGNLNTFQSTTTGTQWFISVPSGVVQEDYISLQDSFATGGATFYAGAHSTDAGNNTNWIFTNVPPTRETAARDENHVPSLLGTSDDDGVTTLEIYAVPTTHALKVEDGTSATSFPEIAASRDQNYVPAIMAVSSVDGVTPVSVYVNSDTHSILITST